MNVRALKIVFAGLLVAAFSTPALQASDVIVVHRVEAGESLGREVRVEYSALEDKLAAQRALKQAKIQAKKLGFKKAVLVSAGGSVGRGPASAAMMTTPAGGTFSAASGNGVVRGVVVLREVR